MSIRETTRFVPTNIERNNETPDSGLVQECPPLPASPPESPKAGDSGGEEIILVEILTQGGARGSCPSLALGYDSVARTGLLEEPAASCRWTYRKMSNLPSAP